MTRDALNYASSSLASPNNLFTTGINRMLYLRNFENNKFLYIEDNFCEEVHNTASAEGFESISAAKKAKAQFVNKFPMLEIVDRSGASI